MCGRIESRSVNNCVSENLNREVSANWSEFQKKKKLVKISLNASFFFFFDFEKEKFTCESWRNSIGILEERVESRNWKF